jgi:hypothetical protein
MTLLLHLPISQIAYNQLQVLVQMLTNIQLNEGKGIWQYPWGTNFSFSRTHITTHQFNGSGKIYVSQSTWYFCGE